MSILAEYPLMEGAKDSLLRPGRKFHRLPASERVGLSQSMLELFQRLHAAHKATPAFHAPIVELIAWADAGQDLDRGLQVWKLELHRATKAMGHGRPALAVAGRPGCEPPQGVKTPYTPTAVPSGKESAN